MKDKAGGVDAIEKAANLLSKAKFPVILSGAGVVIGGAIEDCKKLAEKLDAPVCSMATNIMIVFLEAIL